MTPLLFLAAAACAPPFHALISEILYDAAGDDTGREFVELFNPGPIALPLAGARLEAGDGSGPGRWSLRWTAGERDSIAAGGRFVIGGPLVDPLPDALAALELQNGPDAVRLAWPDGASEVVGYGAQEFAEYACGSAALDAPSGQSLARIPDASDVGGNALDFRAATPSPGRANQPGRDVALVPGSLRLDPERPESDRAAWLSGSVWNRGSASLAAGEISLYGVAAGVSTALFTIALDRPIAAGDTAGFGVSLPPLASGRHIVRIVASLAGDEAPANDADSLVVRVGEGPLGLTEIQFHPLTGEGEWVEVRNQLGQPLEPAGFTLADRRTKGSTHGEGRLDADSLGLLVQDRSAFLKSHRDLDSLRVWQVTPWPSLNNTDGPDGVADAVIVRESDGTLSDRADYSAHGVPAGIPLERVAGSWSPSLEPGGTPMRPPRSPLAVERFDVAPRRLTPGASQARIAWSLPWARARVSVEAFDLAGRRVAPVFAEASVAGRGEVVWTVGSLPAGLYVLVLKARAESGAESIAAARPVRVVGRVP
ncbi:MAG: lamin tail domain-containing protein [Candidatus Eisenbacteria bacterium]|uniref:Lamin tail domain-containing protein n=1 Tax=Eiseniibacteriota bacterium TaxID=2212470 RepID=A0A538TPA6_UNCEI|nr:MAG: lamin tail domain-containing protein [Candidatus Eisenbacteria bacterium]